MGWRTPFTPCLALGALHFQPGTLAPGVPLRWRWSLKTEGGRQRGPRGSEHHMACEMLPWKGTPPGRLLSFPFQDRTAPRAWSTRHACPPAPETAGACTSVKCVSSSAWMAAAALVMTSHFTYRSETSPVPLAWGSRMKATCACSPLPTSEAFDLVFKSPCME